MNFYIHESSKVIYFWQHCLEKTFYGHYITIFNQYDVTGQQSYRIRWKTQNNGYYAVRGQSSRSVSIESPYATSYSD